MGGTLPGSFEAACGMGVTNRPGVVAWVPDLMDRSRLSGNPAIRFVHEASELLAEAGPADTVVVDLGRPAVLGVVTDLAARPADIRPKSIVGFAGHLERDLLRLASEAGCDRVLARSAFFKMAPSMLLAPDDPDQQGNQQH